MGPSPCRLYGAFDDCLLENPKPQAALSEGVSNISFGELSGNLGAAMYQYSFRIPAYYTLLVRTSHLLLCCSCF